MADYPLAVPPPEPQPVPRRVRVRFGDATIVDTTGGWYVWEVPYYPAYYLPRADFADGVLVASGRNPERFDVRVGDQVAPRAARLVVDGPQAGTVRLDWAAMDAWFEEDEQVFVHPRDPYKRVDALRSTRSVRVELDGVVLADSTSPVLVFETGLPTRYYLNRTDVDWSHLEPSNTQTACPYKGVTSQYWSVRTESGLHEDLVWAYDFPTAALLPIAGLVAFYNEKVDIVVDGEALDRPQTHFS